MANHFAWQDDDFDFGILVRGGLLRLPGAVGRLHLERNVSMAGSWALFWSFGDCSDGGHLDPDEKAGIAIASLLAEPIPSV